jgi:L-fuconolactonase
MKIDSHHHFWKFDPVEYGWISDSMRVIGRDFLPADLQREIESVNIDGAISVQARQSLEETCWLLDLAMQYDFLHGVVGWVPLAARDVRAQLDALAGNQFLKGIRHVVHDEPDDNFILRDDFNAGVSALVDYNLVYDVLIFERHLPQAIQFVNRHPQQVFVLDHLAKPRAKDGDIEPWRTNIRQLAERENVFCKVSGLVTEADWSGWTPDALSVYLETVLEAFGPRRLMFGSDWPVCLLASSYSRWYEVVNDYCAKLSKADQARVFGETAAEAYNL